MLKTAEAIFLTDSLYVQKVAGKWHTRHTGRGSDSIDPLSVSTLFRFYRLRFHFVSDDTVYYPAGKAGNVIRGALGYILKDIACVAECPGARTCGMRTSCGYARIFEPVACEGGPSGLQDQPRPFVLRAAHLDGVTVAAGGRFWFDIHLFLTQDPPLEYFILAFSQLAQTGLGPSRGRVRLERVDLVGLDDYQNVGCTRIFENGRFVARILPEALGVPVVSQGFKSAEGDSELQIRFSTPTELKQDGQIATRPEFGLLIGRIAERLSNLSSLYGDPLDWDWRGLVERAQTVRLVEMRIGSGEVLTRFSTKTRQWHGLGGLTGEARYAGRVLEFVPMLEAAKYCGIGRHTVWGNGILECIGGSIGSGTQ